VALGKSAAIVPHCSGLSLGDRILTDIMTFDHFNDFAYVVSEIEAGNAAVSRLPDDFMEVAAGSREFAMQ
jgi:hypothetical protein